MKNPFDLTGKIILVTGASSGLGMQTAITASQRGAQLVITGRNEKRLKATLDALDGEGHQMIIADLTKKDDIERLTDELPRLHGLVYSTGISDLLPAQFIDEAAMRKTFSISFDATVLLNARILKKKKIQRTDASIVFISSISTRYPFVGGAMYVSARAAIEGYARVLTVELAKRKIRVNCVSPAFVRTPMLDQTASDYSNEAVDKIEERQILGLGEPEDVANPIVFFLSDAARWVTGTNLILGGG